MAAPFGGGGSPARDAGSSGGGGGDGPMSSRGAADSAGSDSDEVLIVENLLDPGAAAAAAARGYDGEASPAEDGAGAGDELAGFLPELVDDSDAEADADMGDEEEDENEDESDDDEDEDDEDSELDAAAADFRRHIPDGAPGLRPAPSAPAPQQPRVAAPHAADAAPLVVGPELEQLVKDLEVAHAAVAVAPRCAETAAARAALLARLGVRDAWQRPNFSAQVSALLAALRELLLDDAARGLIVMPCGSGKSHVAVWAPLAAHLHAGASEVIFLVPSLYLVAQLLRTFAEYCMPDEEGGGDDGPLLRELWDIRIICSDASLAAGGSQSGAQEDDLPEAQLQSDKPDGSSVDVTDTVDKYVELLRARPVEGQRPRLIISTYHSLPLIAVRHAANARR